MKKVIFVLLISLLSTPWASTLLYGTISNAERRALVRLYDITGGNGWTEKEGWKVGGPGTENTWYGITCDENNSTVLGITLKRNNVKGETPSILENLKNLETLVLSNNQLTNVHENVGGLSELTTLDLSHNRLKGEIPRWIAKLKNLKKLDLGNNSFTGSIPKWIGTLTDLEELRLDGNRLSGSIPDELCNLPNLKVLRIGHNRLSGKIPTAILQRNLTDAESNFKWNALYTTNKDVRTFLNRKQLGKDWENTQTAAPKGIRAFSISKNSIKIRWIPIAYTPDDGGYRIYYSTTEGKLYEQTPIIAQSKSKKDYVVKGLTPSTRYYFGIRTWTDNHSSNDNTVYSGKSRVVSAATRGITISGYVKTSGGQGVPGTTLTASNNGGSTGTDSNGKYELAVTPDWFGTVTPSHEGYDFAPGQREFTTLEDDLPNQDYTATSNAAVSGRITDPKGNGVPVVTLTLKGKEEIKTETDSTGYYSHPVKYKWTGTVTPSKPGYEFAPEAAAVKEGISGKKILDFRTIPPIISGKVTNTRGKGIDDVALKFIPGKGKPGTTNTNEKGEYSKVILTRWSGAVKPKKKGYIFYPPKKYYENITVNSRNSEENYNAELDLKFFVSVTGNYMVPPEKEFEEYYGKTIFEPEVKAGYKFYRGFFVWGGVGYSTKSGESLESFNEPAKWKQTSLSLGLGYNVNISIKFSCKAEIGVFRLNYKDDMDHMDEEGTLIETFTVSGNALGIRIGGAGIFKINHRLFTEISMGYLYATDNIDNISLELGGLKAGLGIGIKF